MKVKEDVLAVMLINVVTGTWKMSVLYRALLLWLGTWSLGDMIAVSINNESYHALVFSYY